MGLRPLTRNRKLFCQGLKIRIFLLRPKKKIFFHKFVNCKIYYRKNLHKSSAELNNQPLSYVTKKNSNKLRQPQRKMNEIDKLEAISAVFNSFVATLCNIIIISEELMTKID